MGVTTIWRRIVGCITVLLRGRRVEPTKPEEHVSEVKETRPDSDTENETSDAVLHGEEMNIHYDVMRTALGEVWVKEVPGADHEQRILEYHDATTLHASEDEIPWCSSFVNWVCEEVGLNRTFSAAARSWLKVGKKTPTPAMGDIAVFKRGSNPAQGHVAFYVTQKDQDVYVLGGNQSNRVCIKAYSVDDLLAYVDVDSLL